MRKSRYDRIAKKILKKYSDGKVPVNIAYAPYEFEMKYNTHYNIHSSKPMDHYKWNIFLKEPEENALDNRMFIAYCIAMFVDKDGNIPESGIQRNHTMTFTPADDNYKWTALCMLCPYKETVKLLKTGKTSYECAYKFLVSFDDAWSRKVLITAK